MTIKRTTVETKLRLSADVKAQLEALAVERGETLSDTVSALVALAYWGDAGPDDDVPLPSQRTVKEGLQKARKAARAEAMRGNTNGRRA